MVISAKPVAYIIYSTTEYIITCKPDALNEFWMIELIAINQFLTWPITNMAINRFWTCIIILL